MLQVTTVQKRHLLSKWLHSSCMTQDGLNNNIDVQIFFLAAVNLLSECCHRSQVWVCDECMTVKGTVLLNNMSSGPTPAPTFRKPIRVSGSSQNINMPELMEQLTVYSRSWSHKTGLSEAGAGGGFEWEMGGNWGVVAVAVALTPCSNRVNFYSWNEVIPRASINS